MFHNGVAVLKLALEVDVVEGLGVFGRGVAMLALIDVAVDAILSIVVLDLLIGRSKGVTFGSVQQFVDRFPSQQY